MNSKKKIPTRDRSLRHAFIYINILKTDLRMTFSEIAEQLNADSYRTRDGEKYTADKVCVLWEKGKIKYRMECQNHDRIKVQLSSTQIISEILKITYPLRKSRSKLVNESNNPIKKIYKTLLIKATEELNVKLPLIPPIDINLSESNLISALIKVILSYDINPKKITDETMNVLGSLLFLPDFRM